MLTPELIALACQSAGEPLRWLLGGSGWSEIGGTRVADGSFTPWLIEYLDQIVAAPATPECVLVAGVVIAVLGVVQLLRQQ